MIKKVKRMLMPVCLLCRDPLVRIQLQHLLQQVDRCKVNISREDHLREDIKEKKRFLSGIARIT